MGAPYCDTGGGSLSGCAYDVYHRSGIIWTEQTILTASDGSQCDEFGWSVVIDEDTIVVGSWADDYYRGSAYVYRRSGDEDWTEQSW